MNKIKYIVVDEWSAPTFYRHGTSDELYDECDASLQALWVVSYDEENDEIIDWLEQFSVSADDKALARAEELNKKGE